MFQVSLYQNKTIFKTELKHFSSTGKYDKKVKQTKKIKPANKQSKFKHEHCKEFKEESIKFKSCKTTAKPSNSFFSPEELFQ